MKKKHRQQIEELKKKGIVENKPFGFVKLTKTTLPRGKRRGQQVNRMGIVGSKEALKMINTGVDK